jgi:hypothetical protein
MDPVFGNRTFSNYGCKITLWSEYVPNSTTLIGDKCSYYISDFFPTCPFGPTLPLFLAILALLILFIIQIFRMVRAAEFDRKRLFESMAFRIYVRITSVAVLGLILSTDRCRYYLPDAIVFLGALFANCFLVDANYMVLFEVWAATAYKLYGRNFGFTRPFYIGIRIWVFCSYVLIELKRITAIPTLLLGLVTVLGAIVMLFYAICNLVMAVKIILAYRSVSKASAASSSGSKGNNPSLRIATFAFGIFVVVFVIGSQRLLEAKNFFVPPMLMTAPQIRAEQNSYHFVFYVLAAVILSVYAVAFRKVTTGFEKQPPK